MGMKKLCYELRKYNMTENESVNRWLQIERKMKKAVIKLSMTICKCVDSIKVTF